MEKIRISAVKYANTYPFIYGLTETGFNKRAIIETDHPADCAAKLIKREGRYWAYSGCGHPLLKESHIITNFCLGAYGKVRTVLLLSNTRLENIRTVYLDYRSRSSVELAKILARNKWKREFIWAGTTEDFDFTDIPENEAIVLIGDQCFEFEDKYEYK